MVPARPTVLTVFLDYQCPYSDRMIRTLAAVDPARWSVRIRLLGLEQVNVDPSATEWRLWDQPIDYEHHAGRSHRRSLLSFVVTKLLEEVEPEAVLAAFRIRLLDARFREERDLSDEGLLVDCADEAGADAERLRARLRDPDAIAHARARIAEDYAVARADYATFGVPTLVLPSGRFVYVRIQRALEPDEADAFLDRLVALDSSSPWLLELKVPERSTP